MIPYQGTVTADFPSGPPINRLGTLNPGKYMARNASAPTSTPFPVKTVVFGALILFGLFMLYKHVIK